MRMARVALMPRTFVKSESDLSINPPRLSWRSINSVAAPKAVYPGPPLPMRMARISASVHAAAPPSTSLRPGFTAGIIVIGLQHAKQQLVAKRRQIRYTGGARGGVHA